MATMTAAASLDTDLVGYGSSTFVAIFGGAASFGLITGASTSFGTVEGLAYSPSLTATLLGLSTPVGTPTQITIDATDYPLTFQDSVSGIDLYSVDTFAGFSVGAYTWSLAPASTYTLDAQGGSFSLTGGTDTFSLTRKLDAQGDTFAFTGGTNGLNRGFKIDAQGGSYGLSGGANTFLYSRVMVASGGSFSFTGGTNGLAKGHPMEALGGVFALTGGDNTFRYYRFVMEGGDFALSGGVNTMTPFFKTYRFTGSKNTRFSAPHVRASVSMRRSTSFSSRR